MGDKENAYFYLGVIKAFVSLCLLSWILSETSLLFKDKISALSNPYTAFLSIALLFEMVLASILCIIKGMEP